MDQPSQDKARISNAEWLRAAATQQIFALLNQQGFVGRAVGGCVRNSLLAELPDNRADQVAAVTDIDFATTATPEETLKLAAAAGLRTVPTGLQHGTVTVIVDGEGFEVTTLRRDVATDGRHAEVAFTDDWALDAARRDLTINALYADADGTIFDPLGGLPDIADKRIRFVGNPQNRIREDYLRILRFFRFFAQYGDGTPDAEGLSACITERSGLTHLSSERIHQELMKLLVSPSATQTLRIMRDCGILTEVLPTAPLLDRLERLIAIDYAADGALRLAALTVQIGENASRISDCLRLSRKETSILNLVARIQETEVIDLTSASAARRLLYKFGLDDYLRAITFLRALNPDALSPQAWQELIHLPDHWAIPTLPISGRDLLEIGFKPGPTLGQTIQTLEEDWINSGFNLQKDSLIALARSQLLNATT